MFPVIPLRVNDQFLADEKTIGLCNLNFGTRLKTQRSVYMEHYRVCMHLSGASWPT